MKEKTKSKINSAKQLISDSAITNKIKAKFLAENVINGSRIHVSTKNGKVTLVGILPSVLDVSNAIDLATNTLGVKSVLSELEVGVEDDYTE